MFPAAFTTGFALCATLIVAIGAQNAFVLRQGIRREHVAPTVVFCILADFVLIAAGVAGLARLLGEAPGLTTSLTVAGGAFLLWYGIHAIRRAMKPRTLRPGAGSERLSLRKVLAQAAGFTFLNPHVYLDTVLLMGTVGARQAMDGRIAFVGGAACASAVWFTGLGFGARLLGPVFARPTAWRKLDTLVGLTMIALAAMLLWQALSH
ncbi:MAG: LysE/ArgO family amino acid transporter [Gammaproteobacteria bacterium]